MPAYRPPAAALLGALPPPDVAADASRMAAVAEATFIANPLATGTHARFVSGGVQSAAETLASALSAPTGGVWRSSGAGLLPTPGSDSAGGQYGRRGRGQVGDQTGEGARMTKRLLCDHESLSAGCGAYAREKVSNEAFLRCVFAFPPTTPLLPDSGDRDGGTTAPATSLGPAASASQTTAPPPPPSRSARPTGRLVANGLLF